MVLNSLVRALEDDARANREKPDVDERYDRPAAVDGAADAEAVEPAA